MKKFTTFFLMLCSAFVFGQTIYEIDDPKELENETYVPGDVIILKNGTYSTDERIDFVGNGEKDNPIIFKAETAGEVKFTGGLQMNIGGDYVVVDGFHWQGGYGASNFIQFRNNSDYANNSTIQNCVIDGLLLSPDDIEDGKPDPNDPDDNGSISKHRWIVLYGTNNSVINCSFMNKESAGALILVELQYNAEANPCGTVGHTISNNYFYKYEKIDSALSNSGDSETIRVGTSSYQNIDSGTIVSNNYFVEADGENEIITNKSKNNKYINNTFRRCRGSLVLRHGSNATVDGNFFLGENIDGTGGIRITDSNHQITNNYIQDCITVASQAKWNNGITFIGGSANSDVDCGSTSVSNGYQKSENINVSNNTIMNTNAPLFYNTDKGSTDPTGTVSDNLIYFSDATAPRYSEVISGDVANAYANLGTALSYSGNVYKGTTLGESDADTNNGFSLENGITATETGEIFTFSGSGSANKGANMGSYVPATDDMVGNGIGACFTNHLGERILNGDCIIEIRESLSISSLQQLPAAAGVYEVSVTANVDWTAVSNNDWISINISSGSGDETVSVEVTQNETTSDRMGTVTFTAQGEDEIERTLTINQEGADLTDLYELINDVSGGGPVSIIDYSKQQVGDGKTNYAANSLDKNFETQWTADDGNVISGDHKGDGEYVIYDLGNEYILDLIQVATDNKSDPYGLQVWVSTSGTEASDFSMVLPTSGDLLITTTTGTRSEYDQYELTATAQFIKLVGFGRFNNAGDDRKSPWTNITEIEFFGTLSSLSTNDISANTIKLFPNPVTNGILNLSKQVNNIDSLTIYDLSGKAIFSKQLNPSINTETIDVSTLTNGLYFVEVAKGTLKTRSKIIISK